MVADHHARQPSARATLDPDPISALVPGATHQDISCIAGLRHPESLTNACVPETLAV